MALYVLNDATGMIVIRALPVRLARTIATLIIIKKSISSLFRAQYNCNANAEWWAYAPGRHLFISIETYNLYTYRHIVHILLENVLLTYNIILLHLYVYHFMSTYNSIAIYIHYVHNIIHCLRYFTNLNMMRVNIV